MYRPVIATEIEFYLFGAASCDLSVFWQQLRDACNSASIRIFKIEQERGPEQYEISLLPSADVEKIISDTEQLKRLLCEHAVSQGICADFSAKPLADAPGNGLHVHVHLEDAMGRNLYWKKDETMSDWLAQSIAGLLARMPQDMPVFAPTADSRKRFVQGSNAPLTRSWGANNRSCAIRLPDKAWNEKHIEHRVAGADAEVRAVVSAILDAIAYGIAEQLQPPPQIYGDASLPMYELPRLYPE